MGMIDRYTILKWKEILAGFRDHVAESGLRLYALCTASGRTRLISLGVLSVIILILITVISLLHPEKPVSVANKVVLSATDPQGILWKMEYLKNQDLGGLLNGPVKPGQPLKLTVKFLRKQPNLLIKPEVVGSAGEQYFPGILKNGQWQKPPRFAIISANGTVLYKGQFEYG